MTWHFTPYSVPLIIGAVVLVISAFLVLRRSPTLANIYMAIVNILIAIYAGGYGMELGQTSLEGIYFWKKVEYLGGVASPVFLLLLIVAYSGSERWLTRVNHLILMVIPAVSIGFAWTSQNHGLIWNNPRMVRIGTLYVLDYDPGWWYWVAMIYAYLMVILSVAVLLVSFFKREGAFRKQVLLFLAGISLPMLTFGFLSVSVTMGLSFPKINWQAYALLITGLVMAVSLLKFQVFQIGPVAYDAIFKSIGDAIVILDDHNRVIDANPAAISILNWDRLSVIGKDLLAVLSSSEIETLQPYLNASNAQGEIVLCGYLLDLKITSLKNRLQKDIGRLIVMQDITQRVKAENAMRELAAYEERARLSRDLHDGLGQELGYLNVQAQAVETMLAAGQTTPARANLRRIVQAAQKAHADVRNYILGLRAMPEDAPRQDFWEALSDYLSQFQTTYGIETDLSRPDDAPSPAFGPSVEKQLLRIIQEAMTNTRKHAAAHQVQVLFNFTAAAAHVIIADDGSGFDVNERMGESAQTSNSHLGLQMMRERAQAVGGQVEIRSAPEQGACVIVRIPILAPASGGDAETSGLAELRLLLIDDHPLFLEGLRSLLAARGFTVVGVARDGQDAIEQSRALRPDVVLMDLHMPRCDGLEATRAIKAELPETKIVMLTVAEDDAHLFEAIEGGAAGYLLKGLDANQFCSLLAGLLQDNVPLAPGMAARIVAEFSHSRGDPRGRPDGRPDMTKLTPRQKEILNLVAQGLIYKEIAQRLHITEQTVKYHMSQILEKLHVENRAEAIALYLRAKE